MGDRKYLEKRHNTWHVRVAIPPSLRAAFGGKQKLLRSLKTHSLSEAQDKRHAVIAELKASMRPKRKARKVDEVLGSSLIAEAVQFSRRLLKARSAGEDAEVEAVDHELMDRVYEIQETRGQWPGLALLEFSEGLPPLDSKLEAWLAEMSFTERTKEDHRWALKKLSAWMVAGEITPSYDLVSHERASGFIEEALVAKRVHPKTANKLLSGLRTYWKWLKQRGYVDFNPWEGKSLPKQRVQRSQQERPFTDAEVVSLFAGGPVPIMRDLMIIAALSGMRVEEIFQLTVSDCEHDQFNVRKSKTAAGERFVPIHAELADLVRRRCANKKPHEYLIHEAKSAGRDGKRSMTFSKRFNTYRKACDVDEVIGNRRRALVNFHSFRRWFITKADQAGHRREDIERVVGHKVQGMSLGLYSGGVTTAQLKKVVADVMLPAGVPLTTNSDYQPQLRRHKQRNSLAQQDHLFAGQADDACGGNAVRGHKLDKTGGGLDCGAGFLEDGGGTDSAAHVR